MVQDVKLDPPAPQPPKDRRPLINIDWEEFRNIIGWIAGASMAVGIVWAPVSCVRNSDAKIEAAIQKGVDPISAYCAHSNHPNQTTCAVRAATLGKQQVQQ